MHKWPSIILTIFLLVFVVSGIVLNHRSLFSGVDVSRQYLPGEYRYVNWNNAAVKGATRIQNDSLLIYGNIGVWLTDTALSSFSDFNRGFPDGIDNRKVFKVLMTGRGELYAGTLFGLYRYHFSEKSWQFLNIPGEELQVVDLIEARGEVYLLTRSHLFRMERHERGDFFVPVVLPPPNGYLNTTSLFKTLWVIHSGEIAGFAGKLVVDLVGILFAFLSITGIIYWLFPQWIKKRKQRNKGFSRIKRMNLFSLKWHNKVGAWSVFFLFITALTGMFLRPPLLIAIASSQVEKIPFTLLDDPNPWYDQLRRIVYDPRQDAFIVGTNNGLYYADPSFKRELQPFGMQPPVSVMGINVFEHAGEGRFLVGSFNGLFLWDPYRGRIFDYLAPGRSVNVDPSGPPISENMTAGYIRLGNGAEYVFDYNRGVGSAFRAPLFPDMPRKILDESPMSLWNLALEFHTGRFYSFMFGKMYILFIPLFGLTMIAILLSGFVLWWRFFRSRQDKRNPG